MAPVQSSLAPCDSRTMILNKLFGPSDQQSVQAAMRELRQFLVNDSYGAVQTVRMARDAYNARPGQTSISV